MTFSTGVSVSETKAEISTAPATTIPNSRKSRPVNPLRKITGMKTMARVNEVEITANRISRVPAKAAFHRSIPCSIFLKMFSVTTIPSSTTSPVASTIASRVSTLTENPKRYMIKKDPISETGMSINGRRAMTQLRKKRNTISTTREIATRRVSATSVTDCLTNLVLS